MPSIGTQTIITYDKSTQTEPYKQTYPCPICHHPWKNTPGCCRNNEEYIDKKPLTDRYICCPCKRWWVGL